EFAAAVSENVLKTFGYLIATLWLFVLYNTFRIELAHYFHLLRVSAMASQAENAVSDLIELDIIWQIIYTMTFIAVLNIVNLKWLRSRALSYVSFSLGFVAIAGFVIVGTGIFVDLRISFLYGQS